jgi:Flp pilus assembly pilin Flp
MTPSGRERSRSRPPFSHMTAFLLIERLIHDESGQDIIEYGLLGATIGIAGVAIMPLIPDLLQAAFDQWSGNVYDNSTPLDPAGP